MRLYVAAAAIVMVVCLARNAQAAQIRVEVRADVFAISDDGGEVYTSVDDVNFTGESLAIGDTLRAFFVYESDVTGFVSDFGTGSSGMFGTIYGGKTLLENGSFIGMRRIQASSSPNTQLSLGAFISVLDSYTDASLDQVMWTAPTQGDLFVNEWVLKLHLDSSEDIGTADHPPDPMPADGWRLNDMSDQGSTLTGHVRVPTSVGYYTTVEAVVTGIAVQPDAFPEDPDEWFDADGDGIGDNADPDDDNDGILDFVDLYPLGRFFDADLSYWAHSYIEKLASSGITSGCGGDSYCPEDTVTRAQMAVFLERGMKGSAYVPPPASGNVFLDVPMNAFAANFIEQFYLDGITSGCGNNKYCPTDPVTRGQMAVFLLRAKHGVGYTPPPPNGVFGDVSLGHPFVAWIEQLAAESITGGCGGGNYCPEAPVTRAQMAVFLVRTFGL